MPTGVYKRKPPLERFWENVDRSGGPNACWPWRASTRSDGYGQIRVGDRTISAHRFAWETENGLIPHGDGHHGTCVCHRCDERLCTNPRHLFLGSQADNVRDMIEKGRKRAPPMDGERNPFAKLNDDKVRVIRFLRKNTMLTGSEVGALFGISRTNVYDVQNRKQWAHVTGEA